MNIELDFSNAKPEDLAQYANIQCKISKLNAKRKLTSKDHEELKNLLRSRAEVISKLLGKKVNSLF